MGESGRGAVRGRGHALAAVLLVAVALGAAVAVGAGGRAVGGAVWWVVGALVAALGPWVLLAVRSADGPGPVGPWSRRATGALVALAALVALGVVGGVAQASRVEDRSCPVAEADDGALVCRTSGPGEPVAGQPGVVVAGGIAERPLPEGCAVVASGWGKGYKPRYCIGAAEQEQRAVALRASLLLAGVLVSLFPVAVLVRLVRPDLEPAAA